MIHKDYLTIEASVYLQIHDKFGRRRDAWTVHNGTTDTGKAQLALLAGDASAVPYTFLGVGTSNTAFSSSQTTLVAEITTLGLGRHVATISRTTTTVTNDTLNLHYVWTASGTTTIEEIGYFTAVSAGIMGGRALTGSKQVQSTETLTADYSVKFS